MKIKKICLLPLLCVLALTSCKTKDNPTTPSSTDSTTSSSTDSTSSSSTNSTSSSTDSTSSSSTDSTTPEESDTGSHSTAPSVVETQIELTSDVEEAFVGDTISLTVSVEGASLTVSDATIASLDSVKKTVVGLKPGTVTVTASKDGCLDANLVLTFKEKIVIPSVQKLEWEDATHYSESGTWGGGWGAPLESPVLTEYAEASNGKYVGNLVQGNKETLNFNASAEATFDIGFTFASTIADYSGYPDIIMKDMNLGDFVDMTLNGKALDVSSLVLPGSTGQNYYNFVEVKLQNVKVAKGKNSLELSVKGQQGPNLDYTTFYGNGALITLVEGEKGADYESKGSYTYFVDGYEWGPGVKEVMIDFGEGNDVQASSLTADLFKIKTTGQDKKERTITDIYLCDENGKKSTATSGSRIGIEMSLDVTWNDYGSFGFNSYNGCNPFNYNQQTAMNNWDDTYGFSIKQQPSTSLKIGSETYTGDKLVVVDTASANAKVIRATKDWTEKRTHTSDGKTLTYKAFETSQLKNDGKKNSLIIWLHGQGEGGTDPDIALLGNDVTNLGEEKIQSHFKKNGEQGTYVLAVQTPTMWMDDGTGQNHGGVQRSIYTNALKSTIDKYLTENTDIDKNRIYIGGCSNGGYMTMNMIMEYPSFFAAAYPICEAYKDANITDADINKIKDIPTWFVASADDTTVNPNDFVVPTYKRIKEAGNTDVHFSFFEHVYGDDSGKQVQYMGHFSWIYLFRDEVNKDQNDYNSVSAPSTKDVLVDGKQAGIFEWLSSQKKA